MRRSNADDARLLLQGHLTRVFHGHTAYVFCLAYNPQGTLIVSGSFDETLKLWDVGSGLYSSAISIRDCCLMFYIACGIGACLNTIAAHSDPITAVDINKDGTMIASSSHDGLVCVPKCTSNGQKTDSPRQPDMGLPDWTMHQVSFRRLQSASVSCLKSLASFPLHLLSSRRRSHVRFTPNGKFILACSLDSIIRLWSPFTEKAIKTYSGHTNAKCASSSSSSLPASVPLTQEVLQI